jgi:hypothetical protein
MIEGPFGDTHQMQEGTLRHFVHDVATTGWCFMAPEELKFRERGITCRDRHRVVLEKWFLTVEDANNGNHTVPDARSYDVQRRTCRRSAGVQKKIKVPTKPFFATGPPTSGWAKPRRTTARPMRNDRSRLPRRDRCLCYLGAGETNSLSISS